MSVLQTLKPGVLAPLAQKQCALGIMTKFPQAGQVKTRLTPPLTPEEAAALNKCFLRDLSRSILLACRQAPARGVGIYTPEGSEAAFGTILPLGFFLLSQRGDSFGERLINATNDLFAVGFTSVCLINSDSPLVPASSFVIAANELTNEEDSIVLGPSDDGGYYLIGMKKAHRHLFQGVDWSTPRVLMQTKQRAAELGLEVGELPVSFDVDDGVALRRLSRELLTDQASAVAASTQKFLRELAAGGGRERILGKT